jgi:MFS family permease
VGAAVSIGIVGFFITITIYLQSVLGYSALKAGLVLAPSSLLSMVVAPFAGRLSDRIGGKYILTAGLALFAIGTGWFGAIAEVDVSWTRFLPPLVLMGVGMGCIFAPMATEAMRGVPPRLAGAASGLNNTIRQVGSVIGSAAVRCAAAAPAGPSLQDEATTRAPASCRRRTARTSSGASRGPPAAGSRSGPARAAPRRTCRPGCRPPWWRRSTG